MASKKPIKKSAGKKAQKPVAKAAKKLAKPAAKAVKPTSKPAKSRQSPYRSDSLKPVTSQFHVGTWTGARSDTMTGVVSAAQFIASSAAAANKDLFASISLPAFT